jgi:hypothetical protein
MTEPTVRELVAQTRAALDAGDDECAKMLFAALMELLVRKRNERFAQGDSLLPKGPFLSLDPIIDRFQLLIMHADDLGLARTSCLGAAHFWIGFRGITDWLSHTF